MKKGKNLSSVKGNSKVVVAHIEKLWGHFSGNPLFTSIVVFIFAFIIIISINLLVDFNSLNDYYQGLLIEGNGMLFDVIVVILIYNIIDSIRQRKIKIERYLEEIEDYRRWDDSQEASHRISGIIRRLSRLKKTRGLSLYRCSLVESNLPQIDFTEAVFDGSNLTGSNLEGSNFERARLIEVVLERTSAQNTNFQEAYLLGANLRHAHLRNANFQGANLSESKLEGAYLQLADLYGVNLSKANLAGAFLYEADLEFAILEEANLTNANIVLYQLKKVSSLTGAIMPDGTVYDKEWAKKIRESQKQE